MNAYAELDSHADTVVAGSACKVIELTDQSCEVYAYADHYEPITNILWRKWPPLMTTQ